MKKGKILAGLLAALLILSILPASGFASIVIGGNIGPLVTQIPTNGTVEKRLPIVFSYDGEFLAWMRQAFTWWSSNEAVGSWFAPIIDQNRLVLIFGGEANNIGDLDAATRSAVKGFFENGHFASVEIYLTNLSPRYTTPAKVKVPNWSYPTWTPGLTTSFGWPHYDTELSASVPYVYVTNNGIEHGPYYEQISNFIGLIAESTPVNVYLSDEIDSYNYLPTTTALFKAVEWNNILDGEGNDMGGDLSLTSHLQ